MARRLYFSIEADDQEFSGYLTAEVFADYIESLKPVIAKIDYSKCVVFVDFKDHTFQEETSSDGLNFEKMAEDAIEFVNECDTERSQSDQSDGGADAYWDKGWVSDPLKFYFYGISYDDMEKYLTEGTDCIEARAYVNGVNGQWSCPADEEADRDCKCCLPSQQPKTVYIPQLTRLWTKRVLINSQRD